MPTTKLKVKSEKLKIEKPVKKTSEMSVAMFTLTGAESGALDLPKEIFGVKVNKSLLAQAARVYTTNKSSQTGSTKTRGQVQGSTKKIFMQKHTGNARHGARTAPIFVGGGRAFGPKPRKTVLDLPKRMKSAALVSALSQKQLDKQIIGLTGLEKASGKTKQMATLIKKLGKRSTLIVDGENVTSVIRGVRNIEKTQFLSASQLNAFDVLRFQGLVLTQSAIEVLQKRFGGKDAK